MTIDRLQVRLDARSHRVFRLAALVCAALLGMQCIWLLLPELFRPRIDRLPTDAPAAAAAAKHRDAARWAASFGGIRGDLWANSAFTEAALLWSSKEAETDEFLAESLRRARISLDHSLHEAPHRSSAWLLLAGLASRFASLNLDASEPLKMSYYTGPSDQDLVPLRLSVAMQSGMFADVEMRYLVSRDIRLLLARKQNVTLAEIYNAASLNGKSFIRDTDPSIVDAIRSGAEKQLQLPH